RWRRLFAGGRSARAVAPDAVRILVNEVRMESATGSDRADRHDVADLREEFVPALMREDLSRRATFDRTSARNEVSELVVRRVRREIRVIREAFCGPLPIAGR